MTKSGLAGSKTGVEFHLDYFKLTLFCGVERAVDLVERGLCEAAGLDPSWSVKSEGVGRWQSIRQTLGPVVLLEPKPDKRVSYTCVEIKGEGCTLLGDEALRAFVRYLDAWEIRWRALRIDPAWDRVAITPADVRAAAADDVWNVRSRYFKQGDRDYRDNEQGETAYLRKCSGTRERVLRLYNRRGYNRLELELHRENAELLLRELLDAPMEAWASISMAHLRRTVDFVDRKSDCNIGRCDLLPWWAEFIGAVEKSAAEIRSLPRPETSIKLTPLGISEMRLRRAARSLWPIIEAFGPNYLLERLDHYASQKITDEDRRLAQEMGDFKNCGLCGLPGEAVDPAELPI